MKPVKIMIMYRSWDDGKLHVAAKLKGEKELENFLKETYSKSSFLMPQERMTLFLDFSFHILLYPRQWCCS